MSREIGILFKNYTTYFYCFYFFGKNNLFIFRWELGNGDFLLSNIDSSVFPVLFWGNDFI